MRPHPRRFLLLLLGLLAWPASSAHAQAASKGGGGELYAQHCARCHGANGEGGPTFARPIIGSRSDLRKYGTAAGFFEYLLFTMPFDNPQRIGEPEKYAIVGYLVGRHNAADVKLAPDGSNARSIVIRSDSPLEVGAAPPPGPSPPAPPPAAGTKPKTPGKKKPGAKPAKG